MLEPIFGLVLCMLIYLAIGAWATLSTEFKRDAGFERWCASKPIILAVRCAEPEDARHRLRQLLAPHDELVNVHGGAPWQYYRFDVLVRVLGDDVVAVQIERAIPQRGSWTHRPDAGGLAKKLVAMRGPGSSEVWMHGQLHPSEARSTSRDQRSWLGRVAEDGDFVLTPMIGRPEWIGEWAEPGPLSAMENAVDA